MALPFKAYKPEDIASEYTTGSPWVEHFFVIGSGNTVSTAPF